MQTTCFAFNLEHAFKAEKVAFRVKFMTSLKTRARSGPKGIQKHEKALEGWKIAQSAQKVAIARTCSDFATPQAIFGPFREPWRHISENAFSRIFPDLCRETCRQGGGYKPTFS